MPARPIHTALGLMSGTSFDGIDAAIIESDGLAIQKFGATLELPYSIKDRSTLSAAMKAAAALQSKNDNVPSVIREAEALVTKRHSEAVEALLSRSGLLTDDVGLIGFHGQTILHRPADRWTWQIGNPQALADATGINVVGDLRQADVGAGGEGAPLAPIYHAALAAGRPEADFPLLVLNLGGVANVTWIESKHSVQKPEQLLAFDTGPANALIDDWVAAHTDFTFDIDGQIAGAGSVNRRVLAKLLDNDYFSRPPPKSLDRNAFPMDPVDRLSFKDGAATLTAFTARSVQRALDHLPGQAQTCLVTGGGRHNSTLMKELRAALPCSVEAVETVDWRGDSLEAEAFAFLAIRSVLELPNSFAGTTGVAVPCPGGRLYSAREREPSGR